MDSSTTQPRIMLILFYGKLVHISLLDNKQTDTKRFLFYHKVCIIIHVLVLSDNATGRP